MWSKQTTTSNKGLPSNTANLNVKALNCYSLDPKPTWAMQEIIIKNSNNIQTKTNCSNLKGNYTAYDYELHRKLLLTIPQSIILLFRPIYNLN